MRLATIGHTKLVAAAAAAASVGGGTYAVAASHQAAPTRTIHACAADRSGTLRLVGPHAHCHADETAVTWNVTGPRGRTGRRGQSGAPGAPGPVGPTGAPGAPGTPGVKGDTGQAGAAGVPGAAGPAGQTGPAGSQGQTGATGAKGDPGATGAAGAQGQTGAQGPKGDPGATGPAGPQGQTGATGATGPAGPRGPSDIYAANNSQWYSVSSQSSTDVAVLNLPAGSYSVSGQGNVYQSTGTTATCWIATMPLDSSNFESASGTVEVPASSDPTHPPEATVQATAAFNLPSAGSVSFECTAASGGSYQMASVLLSAVETANLHLQG